METAIDNGGAGLWPRFAFANDNVYFCAARVTAPVEREWLTQKAGADYLGVKVMTV